MNAATKTYQTRLAAIRRQTSAALVAQWDLLPNLDKPQAEPFAAKAVQIVTAGQMLAARTTSAYIARRVGIPVVPVKPAQVTGQAARNVDPLEEYQRPFGMVWHGLGEGADITQASAMGRTRLGLLGATDVWLAVRATNGVIEASTNKISGWVRVADATACDLCSAADGLPMSAAADMAGHPGCGCTSEAQTSDSPDSEPADPDLIDVQEHDEMGPVLTTPGQHFAHP